jgi:hypothetical protein
MTSISLAALHKRLYQCLLHPDTVQELPMPASQLLRMFIAMNTDIDVADAMMSCGCNGIEAVLVELQQQCDGVIETDTVKLFRGEAMIVSRVNKRMLLSLFASKFNEWYCTCVPDHGATIGRPTNPPTHPHTSLQARAVSYKQRGRWQTQESLHDGG